MSLQQFVYDVQDQLNPLASEEDLRRIAQQLHSTGEVRAEGGRAPAGRGEKTLLPVVSHQQGSLHPAKWSESGPALSGF